MRNVLAIAFVVLAASFESPVAQVQAALGTISGRAVDAAGRAVVSERVDLIRGGQSVGVATTDARGEWIFPDVSPGVYIVRMSIHGQIAGVQVNVNPGETLANMLIVVPAAAVAPQIGAFAGIVGSMATSAATAAVAVAASATATTEEVALNETVVAAIVNSLSDADKKAFAQQVIAAVRANQSASGGSGGGNLFVSVTDTSGEGGTAGVVLSDAFLQQFVAIAEAPVGQAPALTPLTPSAS